MKKFLSINVKWNYDDISLDRWSLFCVGNFDFWCMMILTLPDPALVTKLPNVLLFVFCMRGESITQLSHCHSPLWPMTHDVQGPPHIVSAGNVRLICWAIFKTESVARFVTEISGRLCWPPWRRCRVCFPCSRRFPRAGHWGPQRAWTGGSVKSGEVRSVEETCLFWCFFQRLLHLSLRIYSRLQLLCETKPSEVRHLWVVTIMIVWPQQCWTRGHWRGGGPGRSHCLRHCRPGKLNQWHVQRLPRGLLCNGFVKMMKDILLTSKIVRWCRRLENSNHTAKSFETI